MKTPSVQSPERPSDATTSPWRNRVFAMVSWTATATAFTQVLFFFRSLIMARLLTPDAYGLFGMAAIVMHAMTVFTEFSLASVIYTRKLETEHKERGYLDTVWTTDLIRRGLISLTLVGLSYPAAMYFRDERVFPVLAVTSVIPFISGFTNVGLVKLQKQLAFRNVALHQQTTEAVTTVIAVAVAYYTRDVWALVIAQVVGAILGVVFSYVFCSYRPRLAFNREAFKDSFGFGKHMFVIHATTFLTTQFDNLVVGRYLGTQILGAYMLAYRLANLPVDIIATVLGNVLFPLYAKVNSEDPERLRSVFVRIANVSTMIVLLVLVPLAIAAEDAITLLYGSKWSDAIPMLRILVFVGLLRGITRAISPLLPAIGRPDLDARGKLAEAAVFIPLTLVLVPRFGAAGAATAGIASYLVAYILRLSFAMACFQGARLAVLRDLLKPAVAGLIAGTAAWLLSGLGLHDVLAVIVYCTVLVALCCWFDPALSSEVHRVRGYLTASLTGRSG